MFWLRNKKIIFLVRTLTKGLTQESVIEFIKQVRRKETKSEACWSFYCSFATSLIISMIKKNECLIISYNTKATLKVRKKVKIRKWYNQVPHLTQDTIWESDKNTRKHHLQESQEVSPFPAGDNKAARNRQDSMTLICLILWIQSISQIKFDLARPTLKIFLFPLTRPCFTGMGRSV